MWKQGLFNVLLQLLFNSHFRNNSNPMQNQDEEMDLIQNDFAPLSHLKTELKIKLSMNPAATYNNDSCINFD